MSGKIFVIDDSTPEHKLILPGQGRGLEMPPRGSRSYEGVADPFPNELLIPRADWQGIIKEQEERKIRIIDVCDREGLKRKNQQQTNYCTTEDTEVLTDRGWVGWPEYNGSDLLGTMNVNSGMLEFQAPLAVQRFEHDGPMVYSTNRSVDFAVTPNHRMLVNKWDESRRTLSGSLVFQEAKDLGWYFGLPATTKGFVGTQFDQVTIEGDRTYDGWDFIALISLVVSDGYAGGTDKTRNWVSFACFREDRLPIIRALAARLGFTEKVSTPGVFIRYSAGALAEWFRLNAYASPELKSHNKKVPQFIKSASGSQIAHFMNFYGDQSHDRGNHFFSTSKAVVDDLQELFLRIGKRSSIWKEERTGKTATLTESQGGQVITSRRMMYHLNVRQTDRLSISRKQHLENDWYKGMVYCASVPNSTLVTRRNGSMLISGNCWINAPTSNVEVSRLMAGHPYVELSPASSGAQIKGFRNVGGWGKEALEWLIKNGAVPVSMWPSNAIDRKYLTAEAKAAAMKYRGQEWWELDPRNIDQLVSCILRGFPVAIGLNWWSHEVLATFCQWIDNAIAIGIDNSWGLEWGTKGRGVLQGSRALPDDAVSLRTAIAA